MTYPQIVHEVIRSSAGRIVAGQSRRRYGSQSRRGTRHRARTRRGGRHRLRDWAQRQGLNHQEIKRGRSMRSLRNGFMATLVFVSLVTAQGVRATVVGRVTDDTGAVVPGAKITITNVGTNDSRGASLHDR